MNSIAEVRRLRLKQFVQQAGLSYAQMNSQLGRNRRDATLGQIVQAAPNTTSGRPRGMGDSQARLLEATFGLPVGWFDSDPDARPDVLERLPSGQLICRGLACEGLGKSGREDWPFATVSREMISGLGAERRRVLERVILAYLGA